MAALAQKHYRSRSYNKQMESFMYRQALTAEGTLF